MFIDIWIVKNDLLVVGLFLSVYIDVSIVLKEVLSLSKNSVKRFIDCLSRAYVKHEHKGLMPFKAKGSPLIALPVFITDMYSSSLDKSVKICIRVYMRGVNLCY